jgi:hypothetical protein
LSTVTGSPNFDPSPSETDRFRHERFGAESSTPERTSMRPARPTPIATTSSSITAETAASIAARASA